MFVKAVEDGLSERKEVICCSRQLALVCQWFCVAAAAVALRPEAVLPDDVSVRRLHDLHLVLARQDRLAVHPVRLTVLQGVVVRPHVEEVADALAAHEDRLGILVGAPAMRLTPHPGLLPGEHQHDRQHHVGLPPGELAAAVAELVQQELALVLSICVLGERMAMVFHFLELICSFFAF